MIHRFLSGPLIFSVALAFSSSAAFAASYSTSKQGPSNQDDSVQRWSTRPSARTQRPSIQYHAESKTEIEGGAPANSTWVVPVMPILPMPVYPPVYAPAHPRGPMPGTLNPRRYGTGSLQRP